MKWRSLFFLFTCLLMQKLVNSSNGKPIKADKVSGKYVFTCTPDPPATSGKWLQKNPDKEAIESPLSLDNKDESSGSFQCVDDNDNPLGDILIRFRTCDNCIQMDAPALSAIVVGNILATVLIAFAVYNITGQPKGKNFSGNKASDKMSLITNGDGDTYQPLAPGQNSEYSRLERKK